MLSALPAASLVDPALLNSHPIGPPGSLSQWRRWPPGENNDCIVAADGGKAARDLEISQPAYYARLEALSPHTRSDESPPISAFWLAAKLPQTYCFSNGK